jgi:hypothetical protein
VGRRSTSLTRLVRALKSAALVESRQGRAAEIAGWANGASAAVLGAGVGALGWPRLGATAAWPGVAAFLLALLLLRLALAHRITVWIASAFGTLTVAALGGALAWLFAHALEVPSLPPVLGLAGALAAGVAPAWGYVQLARRRAGADRDSLLDPISIP